jgi:hypothetical protein
MKVGLHETIGRIEFLDLLFVVKSVHYHNLSGKTSYMRISAITISNGAGVLFAHL